MQNVNRYLYRMAGLHGDSENFFRKADASIKTWRVIRLSSTAEQSLKFLFHEPSLSGEIASWHSITGLNSISPQNSFNSYCDSGHVRNNRLNQFHEFH